MSDEIRLSGYCVHNWTDLEKPCPECEESKRAGIGKLAPVFHTTHQTWVLGAIQNHAARPLTREEIERVIARIRALEQETISQDDLLFHLKRRGYEVGGLDGDESPAAIVAGWFDCQIRELKEQLARLTAPDK
jgi:hypothetical protein